MIDSGRTLTQSANHLKACGAKRIFAFVTHGLFALQNSRAPELIEASALDEVLVANTNELPHNIKERTRKLRQLSVGKLIEAAIRAIHTGVSVNSLFESQLAGAAFCDIGTPKPASPKKAW